MSATALGIAGFLAWVVGLVWFGSTVRARRRAAFEALGQAVRLRVSNDPHFAASAAGEREGFSVLLQRVDRRDGLPPRLDVLLHARLTLTRAGAVTVQPPWGASVEGPPEVLPALEGVKAPVLAAAALVGGRLQFRSLDSLRADAQFHVLTRQLGSTPWSGMLLRTWLPLDAGAVDVEQALSGLVKVRAELAGAPGVTATP